MPTLDPFAKGRTSKMSMSLSLAFQTTHGRGPGAEEGNLHCEAGEQRRQRGLVHRGKTARSRVSMSSMTGQDPVVFEESVKLQVTRKHQESGSKLPYAGAGGHNKRLHDCTDTDG